MNKLFFISLFIVGCIYSTKAQLTDASQKPFGKFNIKLNYSNVTSKNIIPKYGTQPIVLGEAFYYKNPQYGFEAMYKINRLITTGLYFGYSKGTYISNEILSSDLNGYSFTVDYFGNSLFYGLKAELQLLPLLIKDSKLRLNVYCPVQLGLVSQQVTTLATNSKSWDKPAFEIGAGLGISYNITKNIGVFGEYQLGHFYNNRKSQWKVGVLVTF